MGSVEGFCFSLDLFCNTVNEGEWGTEVPSMVGSDGVTTVAFVGTGAEDIAVVTSRTSTIMFVMLLLPSTGVALELKNSLGDNVITAGRLRGGEGMEVTPLAGEQTGRLSRLPLRGEEGQNNAVAATGEEGREGEDTGASCAAAIARASALLSIDAAERAMVVVF